VSEQARYQRQVILPEIGEEGQARLRNARVLVIGAGGLGSPVLMYLAAAGVGTIGVFDDDLVDVSNLHRQILFNEDEVGQPKAERARKKLLAQNPHISVIVYAERFMPSNALERVEQYDLVLDGSDNFATRYLVNDACVLSGVPLISGAIFRFSGQLAVFEGTKGPCYRCLYPNMPDPAIMPTCSETGVLGVLPGVIGSLMATEAIKWICKIGEPSLGRLLRYDALTLLFSSVSFEREPACPICGANARTSLFDEYEYACEPNSLEIDVIESGDVIIDVREPFEYQQKPSHGELFPMSVLERRAKEIRSEKRIVFVCSAGLRSQQAAQLLRKHGQQAYSLRGGLGKHPELISRRGSVRGSS
jgi:molybdopterin/thiamine biosynthesis adenylyltransferase/rhodanese-related sulfurtransferase